MAFQEYDNAPSDSSKKMRVSTRLKNHHRILSDDDKQGLKKQFDCFIIVFNTPSDILIALLSTDGLVNV